MTEAFCEGCTTPEKRVRTFAWMNIILNIPLITLKILTIWYIVSHGKYGLHGGYFEPAPAQPPSFPKVIKEHDKAYYVNLFYDIFWLTALTADFIGSILLLKWTKSKNVKALRIWLGVTGVLVTACFPLGIHSCYFNGFPLTDVVLFLSTYAWDIFGIYCVYTARRAFMQSAEQEKKKRTNSTAA